MERAFDLKEVEEELGQYPAPLLEDFRNATKRLNHCPIAPELNEWVLQGLAVARQCPQDWETTAEYFRVSPDVYALLTPRLFQLWAQYGELLSQDSPQLARAYFKTSPHTLAYLPPEHLEAWFKMTLRLYKATPQSPAIASRFFEASPHLLRAFKLAELERFVSLIQGLSDHSPELATEFLILSQEVLPKVEDGKEALLQLLITLIDTSLPELHACFEAVKKAIPKIESQQRSRFLSLTQRLAVEGTTPITTFLTDSSKAFSELSGREQAFVLFLSETLLLLSPQAIPSFIRSTPLVLSHLDTTQLQLWFNEGVHVLREDPTAGHAYFQLQSSHSEGFINLLFHTVDLTRIKEMMHLYCNALAGANIEIAATQELVNKGIGWVSDERPSTEGSTVYLPPVVNRYGDKSSNLAWYKVVATHQTAHLEFGSFSFCYDRPSNLFKDLRPLIANRLQNEAKDAAPQWLTDMQRLFALFQDRKLALDIFTILEDSRLDYRVMREYAGIRGRYSQMQQDSLKTRKPIQTLPAREAMVEFLVHLSLQAPGRIPVPKRFLKEAKKVMAIAKRLLTISAAVEDSTEATIRIYTILSHIPNQELQPNQWDSLDPTQGGDTDEDDFQDIPQEPVDKEKQPHGQAPQSEQPYSSPQEVDYRGEFKPELVQLLNHLRKVQKEVGEHNRPADLSMEMLQKLLNQNPELGSQSPQGELTNTTISASNLLREAGFAPPPGLYYGHALPPHVEEEGGSLEATEPYSFTYDEWDFRASDYKARWCLVWEKRISEGDINFYHQTLQSHSTLVSLIRRQFEQAIPEVFRKIKHLKNGDEYDLDAVIEAFVDKHSGVTPSEKLYWRRNKVERDVAVAFLLDMSASTAEAIEETKSSPQDWDPPQDPAEYMVWLRSFRSELFRRSYKRIIDLEKESIVLLIQALETLGDQYGIYGFSGYGRENVEFYVIKDFHEDFSELVKMRIDKITPLHATRMGPAIRHATAKLSKADAKTKVLFLISDGRPQDRGYSREGVEKEYAVHDTKMALNESRRKNILPFCLTVDKAGHDYLKTMCTDMGYEVLADITSLPERLPYLYRRLTV